MSPTDPRDRSPTQDDPERLHDLVTECLDRFLEEGEAGIDAVCDANPLWREAIQRRVGELRKAGLLSPRDGDGDFPERLGDFRLIERLGGGGMGVVYLAEQVSLGREVALKLIRPDQLYFPKARERFAREVETVARLQHPGIVPVYTVGAHGEVPYFAMERVIGCTLEDVIAECSGRDHADLCGGDLAEAVRRLTDGAETAARDAAAAWLFEGSWEDTCLRIAQRMAEALKHAHDLGVLHRDVKPSNVMITPGGRVMLVDFGLASAQGAPSLTQSGSQLGSLRYMSPEQSRGELGTLGPRTDVYSLGVTLYELLALSPAFDHATAHQTVLAIQRGDVPSLRAIDPRLSWEAETVCQTAMERDPSRRYGSAADLARDLSNVLDRRPIEARRATAWRRVQRWTLRHPAASVGIALGSLFAVVGPTVFALQQVAAAERIAVEKGSAVEAQTRAESSLRTAIEVIDRMMSRVGGTDLRDTPGMGDLRERVLGDAVELLDELFDAGFEDPTLALDAAEAYVRLGSVQRDHGEWAAARATYNEALSRLEGFAERHPDEVRTVSVVADAWNCLGELKTNLGNLQAARDCHRHSADAAAEAQRAGRLPPELAHAYSYYLGHVGRSSFRLGEYETAEAQLREALEAFHEASAIRPPAARDTQLEGNLNLWLGDLYSRMGRMDDAEPAYRAAIEAGEALRSDATWTVPQRSSLATQYQNFGILMGRRGKLEESGHALEAAHELHAALAAEFPETVNCGIALAKVEINLANHWMRLEDHARAREQLHATELRCEELCRAHPGAPEALYISSAVAINLAYQEFLDEAHDEARPRAREAIELMRAGLERSPDSRKYKDHLGQCYELLFMNESKAMGEDSVAAAEVAVERLEVCARGWGDYLSAAETLARAGRGAQEGAAADQLRERAVAILLDAVAAGHRDEVLEALTSSDLNGAFGDEPFPSLAADIRE